MYVVFINKKCKRNVPGYLTFCYNACWSVGGNQEIHERSGGDSREERRAYSGGNQTVLC